MLRLTTHVKGPDSLPVAAALLEVAPTLNAEYTLIIVALLLQTLDPEQRCSLEARFGMDLTEWYRNNENDAIRSSFQRGAAHGDLRRSAANILQILHSRGLAVSSSQAETIQRCTDLAQFERWLDRALTATSTAEVLADSAPAAIGTPPG